LGGYNTGMEIDLNCDLGEGCTGDTELLALVTSANIACGFHAGDPATAWATLTEAGRHQVQAGAHPGFPDRAHFGRVEMDRTEQQVFEDCLYQVGALEGLARAIGWPLHHLKPHGALYNQACRLDTYARPLVRIAKLFDLPLVGLPGSRLQALSQGKCPFVAEGFADRRYLTDGTLVPRSHAGALIEDPAEGIRQVHWLLREHGVRTICVHGDNPRALAFVREVRSGLLAAGHSLKAFSSANEIRA
jgi:UPF0271 protein